MSNSVIEKILVACHGNGACSCGVPFKNKGPEVCNYPHARIPYDVDEHGMTNWITIEIFLEKLIKELNRISVDCSNIEKNSSIYLKVTSDSEGNLTMENLDPETVKSIDINERIRKTMNDWYTQTSSFATCIHGVPSSTYCPSCGTARKYTSTEPFTPQIHPQPISVAPLQGCVCPPTAEQTCKGWNCPRKSPNLSNIGTSVG